MSQPLLNIAKRVAKAAGEVLREGYDKRQSIEIELKHTNDYVTEIDKASEKKATDTIREYYPNDVIIGEETFDDSKPFYPEAYVDPKKRTWIIDPLDGTRNFIMGNPHFAVSIAVQENGVTTVAVVYNPITDVMYTAIKGEGAKCENRRLRIQPRERGAGYKGAVAVTGFPFKEPERMPRQLRLLNRLIDTDLADIRRTGSASLDMCFVAEGKFDGYFEEGIRCWDIAAGALIVSEAGGQVMDYNGQLKYLTTNEVVCGPIEFCREIVKVISNPANPV